MSMYTYVKGIITPDEKWKQMKEIYDACEKAKVRIPEQVDDFFKGNIPNDLGMEIDLEVEESSRDCQDFFDIDLSKIPDNVKIIRFINSY